MARCPFASWEPIPENSRQARIRPTQVIHHVSAGESTDLYGLWTSPNEDLESHFHVNRAGHIAQYMDTTVMAEANYRANRRPDGTGAVSIETQGGDAGGPWTAAQLTSLIKLDRWLHQTHGIPTRVCRAPSDPGYGWHVMWGAPGDWTPARGKVCPGPKRIQQFKTVIMPALLGQADVPEEDEPVTPADAKLIWATEVAGWPEKFDYLPHSDEKPDALALLLGASVRAYAALEAVKALDAKVSTLRLTGGAVDVSALAKAVADELEKRLRA